MRQSFSFAGFYERRARRILPAFFVMLAFCCIVAPVVLMPEDYQAFVDSVVASVLFVANMLFARHYDYFGRRRSSTRCSIPGRWAWRSSSISACRSCW